MRTRSVSSRTSSLRHARIIGASALTVLPRLPTNSRSKLTSIFASETHRLSALALALKSQVPRTQPRNLERRFVRRSSSESRPTEILCRAHCAHFIKIIKMQLEGSQLDRGRAKRIAKS